MSSFKLGLSGILVLLVCLTAHQPASAATLLTNDDGQLIGANNVTINDTDYNVRFVEGTASSIYKNGDYWNFVFNSREDALVASAALSEQVFIGDYDSDPFLTFGISQAIINGLTYAPEGRILIPWRAFEYSGDIRIENAAFVNSDTPGIDSTTRRYDLYDGQDTTDGSGYDYAPFTVYTTWSLSGTPYNSVPVPGSFLLLFSGLVGLAGLSRKIKQ